MSLKTVLLMLLLFAGVGLSGTISYGQLGSGGITGTARDRSGATVSDASISLENVATGVRSSATTNASGLYVFGSVPAGKYTVRAEHAGFEPYLVTDVDVHIQQVQTVDIEFATGNVRQEVMVSAAAPLLQTEDGSIGQTIGTEILNDVPLNGRNWLSLGQLSAGVAMPSTSAPGIAGSPSGGTAANTFYSVNGANLWQNDVRLNGINNNIEVFGGGYAGSNATVNPPPDAIQEFRLQNGNYNAEFGHSTGAVVDAVTKSGTNALHGDLWEYFRNEALDSNDYFSKLNGTRKGTYRQNQFGGTIGGPVMIPKVYDGRNKTFFFFDYQGTKVATPAAATSTVPTVGMKQSGFSNLQDLITMNSGTHTDGLGRIFRNGTILDPATTRPVAAHAVDPISGLQNATSSTIYVRDPFLAAGSSAGIVDFTGRISQLNILPQSRIDPNAVKLLNLYPDPTNTTVFSNNYYINPKQTSDVKQYDIRIDENFREKDSLFVVFDKSYFDVVTPGRLAGPAIGQSGAQDQHFPAYMISSGYIHTVTPNLLNELHVGFGHSNKLQIPFDANQMGIPEQYGIQGIPQVANNGGLTPISIGGLTGIGESGFRPTIQTVYDTEITENVTRIFQKHNMRGGVQVDDIYGSIVQPSNSRGSFTFSGQFSDIPNKSAGLNGLADMLLSPIPSTVRGGTDNVGGITSYGGNAFAGSNYQRRFIGAYFQDNWKVTSKLTLNLGLRWDFFTPYGDTAGRQANFIPAGGNGPTGTYYIANDGCKVGRSPTFDALLKSNNINIVCDSGIRTGNAQKTNFAPRLGFAYRASSSLAFRGGYGITYGALANLGYNGTLGTNYPFVYSISNSAPNSQSPLLLPNGQTATMENTFAVLNLADPTQVNGAGIALYGRQWNYQTPYVQTFNLALQNQFTQHDSVEIGYVGTVGRHLDILGATNQPSQIQPPGTSFLNYIPFPAFSRGSIYETTNAMSSYNSMQLTYEHQTSFGLGVLANYTYSKCLTNQRSPQNAAVPGYRAQTLPGFGINGDYGLCDADSTHVTHFSGTYKIPVGRGMLVGNSMNRALDAVIGGWQTNWIYTYQTGQPFTISCPTSTTAFFGCFANVVQGQDIYAGPHNRTQWLNPSAFSNPAPATSSQASFAVLGSSPGQARGPRYNNLDASIFKNFTMTERWRFQLRLESFNALNLAQFAQPMNLNFNNPTQFSSITGLRGNARKVQVAAKIFF
ncbi:TonB-dependent receptor [Edaphobacter modestus]|uniref:Carboxypeptidase family protein n=1 Tax=Edaphobacter modestus TaxID=388466 RepID=A0A4Q7YNS6_9BACT|nr:TonB-dependent receptor [Edaphobacter modestus]RZU39297.1 carboxypeptidase family protein [Edaphobacter modestus]